MQLVYEAIVCVAGSPSGLDQWTLDSNHLVGLSIIFRSE